MKPKYAPMASAAGSAKALPFAPDKQVTDRAALAKLAFARREAKK